MEFNKQDTKLLQELIKKYKQGIISGTYPGSNITFTPIGCRDKVISSSGTGGETPLELKFITEADLDVNDEYILSEADVNKYLVVFTDSALYPNAKISVPEGIIGTVPNSTVGKLKMLIIDGGVFNTKNWEGTPSTYIKSLTFNEVLPEVSPTHSVTAEVVIFDIVNTTNYGGQVELIPETAIISTPTGAYTADMWNYLQNIIKITTKALQDKKAL